MESLLANYASDDEEGGGRQEEDEAEEKPTSPPPSKPFSSAIPPPRSTSSSLFSSLPRPKSSSSSSATATSTAAASSSSLFSSLPSLKTSSSSSFFSSLPPPRSTAPSSSPSSSSSSSSSSISFSSSSSLFSSLPPPKSQQPKPPPPSEPSVKRVVQFRPPLNPSLFKPDDVDEDDDDDNGKGKKRTQDFSSKPLSSIMPPPKNTLGLAPSSRRSVIEADVPVRSAEAAKAEAGGGGFGDQGNYGVQCAGGYTQIGVNGQSDSGPVGGDVAAVASSWAPSAGSYDAYGGYGSYEGDDNYGSYGGHWDYGSSAAAAMSATEMPESTRTTVKRARDEIPSEILEVKQDELIKNRPREDQVRLTGIAFGPSYQPASSGKGKPSKLHRRKHQIGSLYFDMKQKEMELAERRAKGFLTKKETQAKYGW